MYSSRELVIVEYQSYRSLRKGETICAKPPVPAVYIGGMCCEQIIIFPHLYLDFRDDFRSPTSHFFRSGPEKAFVWPGPAHRKQVVEDHHGHSFEIVRHCNGSPARHGIGHYLSPAVFHMRLSLEPQYLFIRFELICDQVPVAVTIDKDLKTGVEFGYEIQ